MATSGTASSQETRPNVVLIVADDLGFADLGCYGSDYYQTPHLDRLAREGARFRHAYAAAANCAPTRAALMSGRSSPTTGVYTVGSGARGKESNRRLIPPPNANELDPAIHTLAEQMQAAGYRTGHFGKWHLGGGLQTRPEAQGFDVNVGGCELGHPPSYRWPYRKGGKSIPGLEDATQGRHLTAALTDAAIGFLDQSDAPPFFLYLPYYAVHTPIQPPEEAVEPFLAKEGVGGQNNPRYAALVATLDQQIGRLLKALDDRGLADDTLVIFLSDNGGVGGYQRAGIDQFELTDNAPLRGGKGMYYEGGIRVPWIVRWPGQVKPGRVIDTPIHVLDLYPTLTHLAEAPSAPQGELEGVDLLPLWRGKVDTLPARDLIWHFPGYLEARAGEWRTTPCAAIRRGRWKLIEFYEDHHQELYDLIADPGEQHDHAADQPAKVKALAAALHQWQARQRAPFAAEKHAGSPPPNVILIMADDLGWGDLSCYGQQRFTTPRLDQMAAEGLRFTQHYSGSTVCAPSRAVLMTGKHSGHAWVRGNRAQRPIGQEPLAADEVTIAELLSGAGYRTAVIGKWGLGPPDSPGAPLAQGFDHSYGYNCQRNAHSYYPDYLFRDDQREELPPGTWSHQRITEEALAFLDREHDRRPFFLYLPYTIPHAGLEVPDEVIAPFLGRYPETPHPGGHYRAQDNPHAAYAAMIHRLDRDVGLILDRLAARGLEKNTLVLFTSDNGPHHEGGADPAFFRSSGPFRGIKRDLYEGGIRVPLIAWWPGHITPGGVSDHPSAFWDDLPTLCELAGITPPANVDGISFLPTLLGLPQRRHQSLYWEFHEGMGSQALRRGRWKAVRVGIRRNSEATVELYDLAIDPAEQHDVAADHPDIVATMLEEMMRQHTASELWPLAIDG